MSYNINGQAVIDDRGSLAHKSFEVITATLSSSVLKLTNYGDANDQFGNSVSVGSGRIVVGAPGDSDMGTNSGSAYIYDLTGFFIKKITATDGAAGDLFGFNVAVGSGRIVVGAYLNSFQGAVYIYDLDGNFLRKILAADGFAGDYYGIRVAVGSGRIVVSAYLDDDLGADSGSVYIYDLDGNLIKKITAPDGAAGDLFGSYVAAGSGRIVVGAIGDDLPTANAGSAYIYDLNGTFIRKLTAFDAATSDQYGVSVAVGSDRIVVGTRFDDDRGADSGSAYIYDLDGNLIQKITATDGAATDYYGYSVSIGSNRIVVGAFLDDAPFSNSGSISVYDLNGNLIQKTSPADAGDQFGISVAAGSGRIVVGANGDDDFETDSGSAYIYKFSETQDDYYNDIIEGY